ncbi:MAG TPA: type II toxin-antitoxin system YafQ family toxin [Candidatus Dormibacteraeota bacterium]|nr:type II toxin-antitoxin system YafQ family toxin [Candidatus Dormibacteraeota bacterium]
MKPIRLTKDFDKSYKKRILPNRNLRDTYANRIAAFQKGERDSLLDDHALKGRMKGKCAFSIVGDVRVVYEETDSTYIFLDVGSHNQVYQ